MELWVGQHVQNEWKCLISMYDAARSMYYDITMFDKQFDCTPQLNKMQPHCLGRWSLNTMSNTIYNESNFYSIFASTYQKKKKQKKTNDIVSNLPKDIFESCHLHPHVRLFL